ncbi:heavy metal-binding domain-containing protein, partial [Methanoculleus sp. UBA300]
MILTTTAEVPGYAIGEILGVVFGNTVRTKNIGKDVMAGLKSVVGGELQEYTSMLSDARTESYNRMVNAAHDLGADAV